MFNNKRMYNLPTGNHTGLLKMDDFTKATMPVNPLNFPKTEDTYNVNEASNLARLKYLQNELVLQSKMETLNR